MVVKDISQDLARHETKRPPYLDEANLVHVMIHHSGAGNDVYEDARWHVLGKNWWGMAYRESIDYDGTTYICRKRTEQGWHCSGGGMNWTALPICLRGNLDEHPPTPEQVDAVVQRVIANNFEMGRRLIIVWHDHYKKTSCPGRFMPRAEIVRRVNEYYELPPEEPEAEPEPDPKPQPDPIKPPTGCAPAVGIILLIAAIAAHLF